MTTTEQTLNKATRQQYLNGECTPAFYYNQFITPAGIELVERSPAFQKLKASGSKNLSDMPLSGWDCIGTAFDAVNLLNALGDRWSLAASVVINKAIAAHILGLE